MNEKSFFFNMRDLLVVYVNKGYNRDMSKL